MWMVFSKLKLKVSKLCKMHTASALLQIAKMGWIGLAGYLKRTTDLDKQCSTIQLGYVRNLKHKIGMCSEIKSES